jgi:hypothetical protein
MRQSRVLTREYFTSRVGRAFQLEIDGANVPLTLSTVTPLPRPRQIMPSGEEAPIPAGTARLDPFTLLFKGPTVSPLPQRTYTLSADGDSFQIFIVPVGKQADGYIYEAVFG